MVLFTISGVRGVYGCDLTLELCTDIALAYGSLLPPGSTIALGRDSRPTGAAISNCVASALASTGCNVIDLGMTTTPSTAYITRVLKLDGAIIVSASHNPPEWNALKFLGSRGIPLNQRAVINLYENVSNRRFRCMEPLSIGHIRMADLEDLYLRGLLDLVDRNVIAGRGLKTVLDGGGGAGGILSARALSAVGCKTLTISSIGGFYPRGIEPTPENLERTASFIREVGADVGFAYDCDADRVTLITDEGEILREDYTLALTIMHILSKRRIDTIVVNVATSMAIDDIASNYGVKVLRVAVGEANVVEAMLKIGAEVGGEGSCGGVILSWFNMVRDGLASTMNIVEMIASRREALSDIVRDISRYYLSRDRVDCPREITGKVMDEFKRMVEGMDVDYIDGVRIKFKDGWILVRPSGTEPIIRVMCESRSKLEAERLCRDYSDKIRRLVREIIS
ncbi:MAG: phosphoglucosamine mutase [Candidatus Bathyarchaeia archaeon]|nr:phosphoglucosamine mutase [Candidatus Bathyarchaeota archaeon]